MIHDFIYLIKHLDNPAHTRPMHIDIGCQVACHSEIQYMHLSCIVVANVVAM